MALQVGEMKAKLRTSSLKAELEGSISGCIVDCLRFVRSRAEREKILRDMQQLHLEICKDEDINERPEPEINGPREQA